MNIFKTFEIFLREPLSILKERFFQIVNVSTDASVPVNVSVDMLAKKTQITVVNSDKMYNLLSTVMYKQKLREQKSLPHQKTQTAFGMLLTDKRGR